MTRIWIGVALVAGIATIGPAPALAEVRLTIANGHVNLEAKDATVRQILDEWARVGQTKFVNVERLTGAPLTLQLTDMPETQALEILLRSVSGYLLAPRPVAAASLSQFDRILVMPTSTPPRASTSPTPAPQPAFQPSQFPPGFPQGDSLDDDPAPGPPGANPNPRAPVFPGFPGGPQQAPAGAVPQRGPMFPPQASPFSNGANPNLASPAAPFQPPALGFPVTTTSPGTLPAGVSVPGMVVQPPVQAQPPSQLDPQ
jgi:hypothetical protein